MSAVLPRRRALSAVGQGELFGPVLPTDTGAESVGQIEVSYQQNPVGQQCPTPKRRLVGQAGPSSTPANAGGTPAEPGRSTRAAKTKDSTQKRYTGREPGGPACVGCSSYRPIRNNDGNLTGRGNCLERERIVQSVYRGACGLYEFHTRWAR